MGLVYAPGDVSDVLRHPLILGAVRKRLAAAAKRAEALLGEHRNMLVKLSDRLERQGHLASSEIDEVISSSTLERIAS